MDHHRSRDDLAGEADDEAEGGGAQAECSVPERERIDVRSITSHPDYDIPSGSTVNDVAVLELKSDSSYPEVALPFDGGFDTADTPTVVQALLSNNRFRVYTSKDVVGVELGGALKNVIALAVGASDGLGFGDNTRAALITRGLAEITRLGVALGASPRTFCGLSGMGDLIVTCTSQHSRNRRFGERLGKGETVEQILADTEQAVEGYWNCRAALALARRHDLDMPVTAEVVAVVHDGRRPLDAVRSLMGRDVGHE